MLYDDSTASQTFELYGPKQYSTAEIAELVDREIFARRRHINLPAKVLSPVANILNKALWWHTMSPEEIEVENTDQVIDETAKTFKDLGIEPGDISKFTYHYLVSSILSCGCDQCVSVGHECAITDVLCSKAIAAGNSMTCRRRVRRRRGRRGSTCTFWTINRRRKFGFGERCGVGANCTYVTRFSCVFKFEKSMQRT